MSRLFAAFLAIACSLCAPGASFGQLPPNKFEADVRTAIERMASLQRLPMPITTFGSVGLGLRPDGSLALDQSAVASYLRDLSVNAQSTGLGFLVGHELWHYSQWRRGGLDPLTMSPNMRRQLECEADIMGLALAAATSEAFDLSAMAEAIERLSDLGGGHHLSREVRLRVFVHALARVLHGSPLNGFQPEEATIFRNNVAQIVGSVDGPPEEWAADRCRLILQNGPDQAINAVFVKDARAVPLEPGGGPRRFRLEVTYLNESDRAVQIRGIFGDVGTGHWLLAKATIAVHRFEVTIPPRGDARISGIATLTLGNGDDPERWVEPRNRFPGSEALLQARFIELPACTIPQSIKPTKADVLVAALIQLARDATSDFSAARSHADRNALVTNPDYEAAGITSLTIQPAVPSGASLSLTLHESESLADARAVFGRAKDLLVAQCASAPSTVRVRSEDRLSVPRFGKSLTLSLRRSQVHRVRRGVEKDLQQVILTARQLLPTDDPSGPICTPSLAPPRDTWEAEARDLLTSIWSDADNGFRGVGRTASSWWLGDQPSDDLAGLPSLVRAATLYPRSESPPEASGVVYFANSGKADQYLDQVAKALGRQCTGPRERVRRGKSDDGEPTIDLADVVGGVRLSIVRRAAGEIQFGLSRF